MDEYHLGTQEAGPSHVNTVHYTIINLDLERNTAIYARVQKMTRACEIVL